MNAATIKTALRAAGFDVTKVHAGRGTSRAWTFIYVDAEYGKNETAILREVAHVTGWTAHKMSQVSIEWARVGANAPAVVAPLSVEQERIMWTF